MVYVLCVSYQGLILIQSRSNTGHLRPLARMVLLVSGPVGLKQGHILKFLNVIVSSVAENYQEYYGNPLRNR